MAPEIFMVVVSGGGVLALGGLGWCWVTLCRRARAADRALCLLRGEHETLAAVA